MLPTRLKYLILVVVIVLFLASGTVGKPQLFAELLDFSQRPTSNPSTEITPATILPTLQPNFSQVLMTNERNADENSNPSVNTTTAEVIFKAEIPDIEQTTVTLIEASTKGSKNKRKKRKNAVLDFKEGGVFWDSTDPPTAASNEVKIRHWKGNVKTKETTNPPEEVTTRPPKTLESFFSKKILQQIVARPARIFYKLPMSKLSKVRKQCTYWAVKNGQVVCVKVIK